MPACRLKKWLSEARLVFQLWLFSVILMIKIDKLYFGALVAL